MTIGVSPLEYSLLVGTIGVSPLEYSLLVAGSCVVAGMARHLKVESLGAIYHVTCRMIGDRRLYLFVLMTNHFLLVFEAPELN